MAFSPHQNEVGDRVPLYRRIFKNPVDGYRELYGFVRHPIRSAKNRYERFGEDKKYITRWTTAKVVAAMAGTVVGVEAFEQFGLPYAVWQAGYKEAAGVLFGAAPFTHWADILDVVIAGGLASGIVRRDIRRNKRKAERATKAAKLEQLAYEVPLNNK